MNFEEISIKHRADFLRFVLATNYITCELAFTNLFCLRKKYGTEIFIDNDFMYIRQTTKSNPNAYYYFMPIGEGDLKQAVERIEADAKANGREFLFWGITEEMKEKLTAVLPDRFEFTTNRDWAEYVYLSQKLITLEGSDLKKRRNNLNLFLNKYGESYKFTPLTADNLHKAWEYQEKWVEANLEKNEDAESLMQENEIIRCAFDNWEALGLLGGIVSIDDEVLGYTYGNATYKNTFDIFVEKADYTKNGIYQAINRDFATYACTDVKYINREEDLGIEGLRTSKLKYKPEILLAKYMGCHK